MTKSQFKWSDLHSDKINAISNNYCPICQVLNLTPYEAAELGFDIEDYIPNFSVRGATAIVDGIEVCYGTSCWDSSFGDECGACLNVIANPDNYVSIFQGDRND